jgi:transcriptional regulator with XRE-family HTH domain
MLPLTEAEIERLRTMRRNGMTVRDIEARAGVSRQTVQKYTANLHDRRQGHAYKAPIAPRFTVERTMPNGTRRSVTADTMEQADKVCNWQLVGDVAAKIVAKAGNNRLGPKAEHATKRTGREGVGSTDPALTATDL